MKALLVASSLEVNGEQNKHMAMPREENSRQNNSINMGNNGGTFQLFGNNGNESLLHA
jgi:hypothetical protein